MTIDLEGSEAARSRMIKKFGFVPLSVLSQLRYGYLSKCMLKYQAETPRSRNAATVYSKRKVEKLAALGKTVTTIPPSGTNREALSIMPAELVDFFVKFYTEPGEVYIDPFMAQGVQMQVAHMRGLHYIGVDLSAEFVAYCRAILPKVMSMSVPGDPCEIECHQADSRAPTMIEDGIGDFSFHSPPYWDIEFYGDEPEQLGTGKSYEEFLDGMQSVAAAWLPKFKKSATHVVNVGDFIRDGRFYCYHADLIVRFERAGWRLHDIWIIDQLVAGSNRIFAVSTNNKGRAPRVHEYALVFKPAT